MYSPAMKHRFLALSGACTLILVLAAVLATDLLPGSAYGKTVPTIPALAASVGPDSDASRIPESGTFAPTIKKASPAVVSITVSMTEHSPAVRRHFDAPFFGPGFGPFPNEDSPRRRHGSGSGVIISEEGYIVTNHHVIEGADEIKVHLADKRSFDADLIGADAKTDIAVLKFTASDLPVLPLGNSDDVEIGDIVLAIGNPFGIGQTVTMGIVGATGRGDLGIKHYEDFIQTDAAINPGNSGGALINVRGELVGINTAILSRGSGGNQGVGFAVPVNLAHHVMTQLVDRGRVVRGYLGVGIQDLNPKMAQAFELPDARGALVRSVQPHSPAADAGLEQGDVIIGIDGEKFDDSRELRFGIAAEQPGTTLRLAVIRDGDERTIPVQLGEFPEENRGPERSFDGRSSSLGLTVDELTSAVARQLDLPKQTQGVVVVNVKPGSPAAEADLRRGDVISEVARRPVLGVADFHRAVRESNDSVLLLIQRGDDPFFTLLETK